ncbi:MAG TPA: PilT/PilU family type 4a pilus ATPase [Verrucomicrobiae bacterium]|jgi:twitching motility protein PilT|nr:PilT/PilU family type 4a pilus ATPase [Verrucomicrobiae bacterium]
MGTSTQTLQAPPTSSSPEIPIPPSPPQPARVIQTAQLITAMVKSHGQVSDLIFSPGRAPQIEMNGQLVELKYKGLESLTAQDTMSIANDIMSKNETALRKLEQDGSADLSYGVSGVARFRVNIFRQRGSCAIVMRVVPDKIPNFEELNLPKTLQEIVDIRNGIVLVTGPTGSGKSSTLAAILDRMNEQKAFHILTIEDPIEFLHRHKKCTIHQRELHTDTPTFGLALRAALRQAPKVILVGEMRDRETIEIALEASETGHLVMSTLHTIDASKTVERIVGVFPLSDQQAIRTRLGKSFRFIVSQRLLPKKDGTGRIAAIEILKSTMRTRDYVEKGEGEGKTLLDAMRDGNTEGMQHFDGEIEKLIRNDIVEFETAMTYATNAGNLRLELSDFLEGGGAIKKKPATEIEIER